MYMHDPFPWTDHTRRTGRVPWQRGWGARLGPSARARVGYRRRLAAIERDLTANAPALTSKFAVFNHLTKGERPVGVEQVSLPARSRVRILYAAALLGALAAMVAMCVTLTTQLRPAARPCQVTAAGAVAAAAGSAHAPVRGAPCPAYPGK
jgi:Protein of unknown function (DUF3040)